MLLVCGSDGGDGFRMLQACVGQGEYRGQVVVLNDCTLVNEL